MVIYTSIKQAQRELQLGTEPSLALRRSLAALTQQRLLHWSQLAPGDVAGRALGRVSTPIKHQARGIRVQKYRREEKWLETRSFLRDKA